MSLDWNVDKIHDYKNVCWKPDLGEDGIPKMDRTGEDLVRINPITDVLIWATMPVGINTITVKNYEEFYWRMTQLHALGRCSSMSYFDDEKDRWIARVPTLNEVDQHIGLSTNAAVISGAKFDRELRKDRAKAYVEARRDRAAS